MRRQNEAIAHELATQKDRQEADLQAKLMSRRAKKQLEARRLAEEATAQRILAEQEKLVDKDGGDGFDGLQEMSAAKIAELSMEEQVSVLVVRSLVLCCLICKILLSLMQVNICVDIADELITFFS